MPWSLKNFLFLILICRPFLLILLESNKYFFSKILSNKIKYKISKNLNYSLLLVFKDLRQRVEEKKIILFSPSAASFDQFNNFEDRGKYFNKIIKNYLKK